MPDKPLTIATYAAGASLAAITLVYVFGPTFFLDDEAAQSSRSSRKKGVVGLSNPANDCFINSVLQTLAGLPELRVYLIRELHRRKLGGIEVYGVLAEESGNEEKGGDEKTKRGKNVVPEWKTLGLQKGMVTAALKDVLDALNERPIYKKTISAQVFISALEHAFNTRLSRQQQDAQEFLQIVTERLCDEYHAGYKARKMASKALSADQEKSESSGSLGITAADEMEKSEDTIKPKKLLDIVPELAPVAQAPVSAKALEQEPGFPFEGKIESQIRCLHCNFTPKPAVSSFVTLTLNVPQLSATSLSSCFDGMLKIENIDGFKCDRCRLQHALETKQRELSRLGSNEKGAGLEKDIAAIEHAIATDPETPPKDVKLPDISLAPKRRITRHMRISVFPRILAIHLSRSMWDTQSVSTKNLAKVSFPETLPLGGLLDQVSYSLLGVVTHKGGHNSGHYESFRRQVLREPYSTPAKLGTEGLYSTTKGDPSPSSLPSPVLKERASNDEVVSASQPGSPIKATTSSPSVISHHSSNSSSSHSSHGHSKLSQTTTTPSVPTEIESVPTSAIKRTESSRSKSIDLSRFKRKAKKGSNRWWRISDDKIKESKTSDVLGMQKEVYLLFYELVPPDDS